MKFDGKIDQFYDMTVKELLITLENRKKGLAYKLWKMGNLIGASVSDKYPKTPEEASPELFPPPKRIERPQWWKDRIARKGGQ